MITSVEFRSYRVLNRTTLSLGRFNLILGPNGSGKSTAVQALLALRDLAAVGKEPGEMGDACEAHLAVSFDEPFQDYGAAVACGNDGVWGSLAFSRNGEPVGSPPDSLARVLSGIRSLNLEATALARPSRATSGLRLGADGSGFSALLGRLSEESPDLWSELVRTFQDLMPEFTGLSTVCDSDGVWSFSATNQAGLVMQAGQLSQGTLVALALNALAFLPDRPTVLCLEELERGIHPRLLREVRDSLYRLCYPEESSDQSMPVQVIATTHSPYLLDLFDEHPEEVILTVKEGSSASFIRLTDVPGLDEMLESASLGDLWYSGVIGGVPW